MIFALLLAPSSYGAAALRSRCATEPLRYGAAALKAERQRHSPLKLQGARAGCGRLWVSEVGVMFTSDARELRSTWIF